MWNKFSNVPNPDKLTETKIGYSSPATKRAEYLTPLFLYLSIRKVGLTGWVNGRKLAEKAQIITLGNYPETSLKQAGFQKARWQLKQDASAVTMLVPVIIVCQGSGNFPQAPRPGRWMHEEVALPAHGWRKPVDVTRTAHPELSNGL